MSSALFRCSLAAAALAVSSVSLFAQVPAGLARNGRFLGQDAPSRAVDATVWLNLHNKAELDARVAALYTKGSPTFHQWLTAKDLQKYAPTAAEAAAVTRELAAHNLKVTSVDSNHYSVRVSGTTSAIESAFHTQVSTFQLRGEQVRAFTSTPALSGGAAGLVKSVTGIAGPTLKPMLRVRTDRATGKPEALRPTAQLKPAASPGASYSPQQCFTTQQTIKAQAPGSAVSATYTGYTLAYDSCLYGYYPQDLWNFYGLNNVYAAGYTGAGQTIVIIDAYGSPNIQKDLDTFSQTFGLPSTTVQILQPSGTVIGYNTDWAEETSLDVEWAHAMAPGANIVLLEVPSESDRNLQTALQYAITNHLGNVITNSYGGPESQESATGLQTWDQLNELAAAAGISVHYSSGDNGDYESMDKTSTPDVSTPADSPYATAVGGTSIGVNPMDGSLVTTGWGNNVDILVSGGVVQDPPDSTTYGFFGGSGGGISNFFAKPAYQNGLSGSGRHIPDVSALADPFTGVAVVFTPRNGAQGTTVVGGTSLAAPVFSAIWSLLCQYEASSSPNGLGQAAPYVAAAASLGLPIVNDVIPPAYGFGASGSITDATGTTNYNQDQLSQPLQTSNVPINVLYGTGNSTLFSISFASDSSLAVTGGWDPVSGYGSPDFHWFQ